MTDHPIYTKKESIKDYPTENTKRQKRVGQNKVKFKFTQEVEMDEMDNRIPQGHDI